MPKRKSNDVLNEFGFKKPKKEPEGADWMDLDCEGSDERLDHQMDNLVLDPTINDKLHQHLWKKLLKKIKK